MIHPKHKGRYVQGPWPKYFSGVRRGYVLLTPCKTPIRLPMGCVEEGEYNQLLVMCELTGECEWMDERTLVDVPSRAAWEQQQEISSTSLDAKPGTWESNDPLATARAEANDLMQRLTESQQEVAKARADVKRWNNEWYAADKLYGETKQRLDEATQELAEVKAERDRLAAQVETSRQKHLSDAHYEGVLESVIAKVRAAIDGK